MNVFETLIISIVVMLFPVLCYLFYVVANKNFDEKKQKLVLCFTYISTFYFISKINLNIILTCLLITIPIFISLKKNNISMLCILSILSSLFFFNTDYIIYYIFSLIFGILINKNKNTKQYIGVISIISFIYILFNSLSLIYYMYIIDFILIANLVFYTINNGEEVINYHLEYKDLKKENEIRKSLFKISHEIKNPLAVCKAYIDLFDNNDIESFKKYVPIISREIDKMLILLQDFLLVNKDNINQDIMDINMLLEDTISSILNLKKFDIELNCSEDEVFINGDYNRLSQVITNMIKNSYEAESSKIIINSYLDSSNVVVEIIDNGTGIENSIMDKIYEPFYTTKKDGTGLGVALSKEIVEAHDGTLKYFNNIVGTTAKISLPLYSII